MTIHSTEKLLEEATKALDQFQPQIAAQFFIRAFENTSDYQLAHQAATCFLQIQDEENARKWFINSLKSEPDQYYSYLQLAQFYGGFESSQLYEKGIMNLEKELLKNPDLKSEMAGALCSLVELYMTDLCEENDAESRCEKYLELALKHDPNSYEVLQTLASVRISQCRNEDAKEFLEKSMDSWYSCPTDDAPLEIKTNWPLYAARIALAKLLIEIGALERALMVLETCELENEDDPECWYLYGWCYLQIAETEDGTDRQQTINDARDCLCSILELKEKLGDDAVPVDMLEHTNALLSEIGTDHTMQD